MMQAPNNSAWLRWYAVPVSSVRAEILSQSAKCRLNKAGQRGQASFVGLMMQTIADWWLEPHTSLCLSRGLHYADSQRKKAIYHLLVGQLLMSCKMDTAMEHLDTGLRHADGLIPANDYFTLYNRHEELRYILVSNVRQKAYDLPELLNESRVIRKLTHNHQYSRPKR